MTDDSLTGIFSEERRKLDVPMGTITLLFTDIEGSTLLLQQLGEQYSRVLTECRQMLRTAFQRFQGYQVDTQGDALFFAFARATDALSAAVAAQRALASHAWPDQAAVRVRMELHTGEPQRSADGYVGLDVHRAARIMSAGHGGQVLLSQTMRHLVEHHLPEGVSLRDLGEYRLKDLRYPSQMFQLVIAGLPADFPPLRALDSSPNNLPLQPTPFIGREREVAAVQLLLLGEQVRLVTLTGPGGVGKTRLGLQVAAEVAERFPDGAWFVSLAHLQGSLHEKQMLLLLDNFEQVVSTATHVSDLLGVCSRLKMLVTSREGPHVRAEHEFPVPTLALPDAKQLLDPAALSQYEAVGLFVERAQAVQPEFRITHANAPYRGRNLCSRRWAPTRHRAGSGAHQTLPFAGAPGAFRAALAALDPECTRRACTPADPAQDHPVEL